jgi:hypothetical protein
MAASATGEETLASTKVEHPIAIAIAAATRAMIPRVMITPLLLP